MNILTIDFETYYSRDFSLSKMTTEEYIRSPHFEVIGVAVKVNDGETYQAADYSSKTLERPVLTCAFQIPLPPFAEVGTTRNRGGEVRLFILSKTHFT